MLVVARVTELEVPEPSLGLKVPTSPFRQTAGTWPQEDKEEVRIWDTANGQAQHTLTFQAGAWVTRLAYSPDGQRLISAEVAEQGESMKVWDPAGREFATFQLRARGRTSDRPDQAWPTALGCGAAFAGVARIRVLDAATGAELLTLEGSSSDVRDIAFSADSRASLREGGLDTTTALSCSSSAGAKVRVGFSPDGGEIAALSRLEVGI